MYKTEGKSPVPPIPYGRQVWKRRFTVILELHRARAPAGGGCGTRGERAQRPQGTRQGPGLQRSPSRSALRWGHREFQRLLPLLLPRDSRFAALSAASPLRGARRGDGSRRCLPDPAQPCRHPRGRAHHRCNKQERTQN